MSAAYYALFHFLIGQACRAMFGDDAALEPMRLTFARAFNHSDMKVVSRGFADGNVKESLKPAVPKAGISREVQATAKAFIRLQEKRHIADYDLAASLTPTEVETLVRMAELIIAHWPKFGTDPSAKLYLIALFAGAKVRGE